MESEKERIEELNSSTTNIPIQLCSVCSTQGVITPRWFRYETKEHEILMVQVEKILSQKDIQYVGIHMIQYICCARMEEKETYFELRYDVEAHKWRFFQKLA